MHRVTDPVVVAVCAKGLAWFPSRFALDLRSKFYFVLSSQSILNGTFVEVVSGKKILGLRILKLSQFKVKSILTRTINYF